MPKFGIRTLLLSFVGLSCWFAIVLAILQLRAEARESTCKGRVRQIVLMMLNYESAHRALPIGIETSSDGTPYRSWRTHLPAFTELGSAPQYYDSSFGWDSARNTRLSAKLDLDCWRCSADSEKRVNYAVVVGEETAFPLNRSVELEAITDGLENTILVVETLSGSTKWTEPRDLEFDKIKFVVNDATRQELASRHRRGVNVGFADGQVYSLDRSIAPDELRALLTIAGNEPITREGRLERGVLRH